MLQQPTIVKAIEMKEGAGAKVKRLFPVDGLRNYDPFVLIDEFFVDPSAGFPTHPHRGFEAITYMLEGSFNHQDNLGHNTTVRAGGIQRFTAGKGLSHSEMPMGEGVAHGFQIWINLPQRLKQIDPDYQQVNNNKIPESKAGDTFIRTIVGDKSPVKLKTAVQYLDITLKQNKNYLIEMDKGFNGLVYLIEGVLKQNEILIHPGEALLLNQNDNLIVTGVETSHFIVLTGKPHGEPIRQRGAFVD